MEETDEPDVAPARAIVVDIPGDVRSPWKYHPTERDRSAPLGKRACGRIGTEQIDHTSELGLEAVDPRRVRVASKPVDLALEIATKVVMEADAARQRGSGGPRTPFCHLDPRLGEYPLDLLRRRLSHVARLDLLPCRPGLRSLPFLCRGERSEEHTSELQSRGHLVCRLL